MPYDETLAARIRKLFHERTDVTEREMFGGLAFMYRDRMCWGIVGADLVVRVAEDEFEVAMRRRHVRPMDFAGRPLKGFVYVSPPSIRSPSALRSWLEFGERFAKQASTRKVRRKPSQRSSGQCR